jgi:competence protein ComEA
MIAKRSRGFAKCVCSAFSALRARLADSAWTPLLGKIALGGVLFVALALVGSGAAQGLLPARGDAKTAASAPLAEPPAAAAVAPTEALASDAGAPASSETLDGGSTDAATSAPPGITTDGKVILNLATEDELRRLPGIGPTRARGIVDLRKRLGKIRRPEDLMRVKGIGRRLLARIRPLMVVDPPSA